MIKEGDKVTCRPDGKVRGATVKKVLENGDILVDCQAPKKKEFLIKAGKYQLSAEYNDPASRIKL